MIYLRTGANGTCKTLFTLADVRKLQLETGRPVCINSRFKMNEAKRLEFGWTVIDFKDWQAQQDGTIFFIDECHNDMPVRPAAQAVPEAIRMLAEHRSRGFDFFLLTQHPMNIDGFVRKLVGAPGWHQHLKRVFGGTNTTRILQWDAVNTNCEKDGSGKTAQITTRMQPKEVYSWYDSATLHTAKVRIPSKVWVLLFCVLLIPALFWLGFRALQPKPLVKSAVPSVASPMALPASAVRPAGDVKPTFTAADYVASYVPRIDGLPQTATRYDDVTKPTTAPYPAACVQMGKRCDCYTQQGTKLQTAVGLCSQIVKNGYFLDWSPGQSLQYGDGLLSRSMGLSRPIAGNPGTSPDVALQSAPAAPVAASARDGEVLASMARPGGYNRLHHLAVR